MLRKLTYLSKVLASFISSVLLQNRDGIRKMTCLPTYLPNVDNRLFCKEKEPDGTS